MSKRRYGFDEQKIERFHKEGRGTGRGADYKPWLTVQDVPSTGLASRIPCLKTGRHHELLSNIETGLFVLAAWSDAVVDIREQYPLDRDVTRRIAREMDVRHPRDPGSGMDIFMTTDLLIDVRVGGRTRLLPRAVKPADKLGDPRVVEKLEIERRYWALKGAAWAVVTERDLPQERVINLRWLLEMETLEHTETPHADYWPDRCNQFLASLSGAHGGTTKQFLTALEAQGGFRSGDALMVLRHLGARKRIAFDLDRPFSVERPLSDLWITDNSAAVGRRA